MERNNLERISPISNPEEKKEEISSGFDFSFPNQVEIVDLPSKGKFYSKNSSMFEKESVEIKFPTAKEEDILVNKSYIKKGNVLDKFLASIVIDKKINIDDILISDKNALLLAARILGYGEIYKPSIICPECEAKETFSFNLNNCNVIESEELDWVTITEDKTFIFTSPITNLKIEVRLLDGHDEKFVAKEKERKNKLGIAESSSTDFIRSILVSLNGNRDPKILTIYANNMLAKESKFIRETYTKLVPKINMEQEFVCSKCSYEGRMEVPITAEFFWPK